MPATLALRHVAFEDLGWLASIASSSGSRNASRRAALVGTPVLHWHGDTFDLPDGAVHLASTAVCRNQAFAFGEHTLALQFRAETAGGALEAWFVGHTWRDRRNAGPERGRAACRHGASQHAADRARQRLLSRVARGAAALNTAPLLGSRAGQNGELSTRPQFALRPCATVT